MKIPKPYYRNLSVDNEPRVWAVNWLSLVMVMAFGWFWGFGIAWLLAAIL